MAKSDDLEDIAGILNKCVMTQKECAAAGVPTSFHHEKHGYQLCACAGEYTESSDTAKIVSLHVDKLATKEGFLQAARVTMVNTTLKFLLSDKIKVEGHVSNYNTASTGLDAIGHSEVSSTKAEITKKVARTIDRETIVISFDPAEDLHSIKLVCTRIIDVRNLYKKDLEYGLLIDKESLVKRYLKKDHWKLPKAVQAMSLALLFYASHNWQKNLNEKLNTPLPLFPMSPKEGPVMKHRSKQSLIGEVHQKLMWKYRSRLIRPPTPVLIGRHVIRVHVKKWNQLQNIAKFLEELGGYLRKVKGNEEEHVDGESDDESDEDEHVDGESDDESDEDDFRMISLPISMKTKSQKKGFFVYLDFESEERAELAVKYFSDGNGETKYKCEPAIPRAVPPTASKGRRTEKNNQTYTIF